MGKVYALDSNIVIWGIKQEAQPGQEGKIGRAKELLRVLDEEKAIIIIPAPVIAEIMFRVPVAEHAEVMSLLSTRFRIAPFDTAAAMIAAQIRQRLTASGDFKKIQANDNREAIKFDIQIVAIAKLHGVKALYSEDKGLRSVARDIVKVSAMPNVGTQLEAFTLEPMNEKPLKIKGTLTEVLRVAVRPAKDAPKPNKKAAPKKKAAPTKRAKKAK
jgi:predicted nucleic acid-binding protein